MASGIFHTKPFYALVQSDRHDMTLLTLVLHIGCMKICNYIKGPAFCALLISTFHFSFLATQNMVYCKYFNVLVSLLLNKQVTSRIFYRGTMGIFYFIIIFSISNSLNLNSYEYKTSMTLKLHKTDLVL